MLLRAVFRGQANGAAFQGFADELAVADGGEVDRGDIGADLRHDAQQALFQQAAQDLAHRGAADGVLFGQPGFRQALARRHPATDDVRVQALVQAVAFDLGCLEPVRHGAGRGGGGI